MPEETSKVRKGTPPVEVRVYSYTTPEELELLRTRLNVELKAAESAKGLDDGPK